MIYHIPTIYLEAETKLPTLIHLERFLYLTIWLLVLWGGEKRRLAGILTNSCLRESFRTQTIWVELCPKNIHSGYPNIMFQNYVYFFSGMFYS